MYNHLYLFQTTISFYLGGAIFLVGLIMSFSMETDIPKIPDDPIIWVVGNFVAALGVSQQLCLIGKLV